MIISCKITVLSPLFHSVLIRFMVSSTTFGYLGLYLLEASLAHELRTHVIAFAEAFVASASLGDQPLEFEERQKIWRRKPCLSTTER